MAYCEHEFKQTYAAEETFIGPKFFSKESFIKSYRLNLSLKWNNDPIKNWSAIHALVFGFVDIMFYKQTCLDTAIKWTRYSEDTLNH